MFGRRGTEQKAIDKKPVPRRAPEPEPAAPAAAAPERVASKPEPEPAKPEPVEPAAERVADIGMVPSAAAIARSARK